MARIMQAICDKGQLCSKDTLKHSLLTTWKETTQKIVSGQVSTVCSHPDKDTATDKELLGLTVQPWTYASIIGYM